MRVHLKKEKVFLNNINSTLTEEFVQYILEDTNTSEKCQVYFPKKSPKMINSA